LRVQPVAPVLLIVALAVLPAAGGQQPSPQPGRPAGPVANPYEHDVHPPYEDGDDPVVHGRYLVHHVAMCIYCHTPKRGDGTLVREELLRGSPLPVKSPYPGQEWGVRAPKIAGLPGGFSEEALTTFLETGETPYGYDHVKPPMPPFRMSPRDARAVVAYLKSLAREH